MGHHVMLNITLDSDAAVSRSSLSLQNAGSLAKTTPIGTWSCVNKQSRRKKGVFVVAMPPCQKVKQTPLCAAQRNSINAA